MTEYTLLTVISIIALLLSIISILFIISLSIRVDNWYACLEDLGSYADALSDRIRKQRSDFDRSLLTIERKEKELDERTNLLQQRLNLDRMQNIIDGKITD